MNERHNISAERNPTAKAKGRGQGSRLAFDMRSAKVTTPMATRIAVFVLVIPGLFWVFLGLTWARQSSCLAFGLILVGLGFLFAIWETLSKKAEFDFVRRIFYPRGRGSEEIAFQRVECLEMTRIVNRFNRGRLSTYALDVLLKDGSRRRILTYLEEEGFKADVERLASKMSVPLKIDTPPQISETQSLAEARKNALVRSVVGIGLLGMGLFWLWIWVGSPLWHVWQSGRWAECPAVVRQSELQSSRGGKGGRTYRVHIQYQYEIDGKHHIGERYDFFMSTLYSNLGYKQKLQAVNEMPVGKEIICLVNPEKHAESVISREVQYSYFVCAIFPLIPTVMGLLFLGGVIFGRKKERVV